MSRKKGIAPSAARGEGLPKNIWIPPGIIRRVTRLSEAAFVVVIGSIIEVFAACLKLPDQVLYMVASIIVAFVICESIKTFKKCGGVCVR